jgi:hypothetical protein
MIPAGVLNHVPNWDSTEFNFEQLLKTLRRGFLESVTAVTILRKICTIDCAASVVSSPAFGEAFLFGNPREAIADGIGDVQAKFGGQFLNQLQLRLRDADVNAFHGHTKSINAQKST